MATVKYNLGTVSGISVTELWSGTTVGTGTITFEKDISEYKLLVLDFIVNFNGARYFSNQIISTQHIINVVNYKESQTKIFSLCWGYSGSSDYFNILNTSTLNSWDYISNNSQCTRIVGIN